jgi:hypothetical protein
MANGLYDRGRQAFLANDVDWDTDDLRLILVDEADDTPDLAADEDLADRAAASRVATSDALANPAVTDGIADADNKTFSTVTGDEAESIDCYYHTGTEATSLMIFNIDTATGLAVTPNGGDITVAWDDGANKIFKL